MIGRVLLCTFLLAGFDARATEPAALASDLVALAEAQGEIDPAALVRRVEQTLRRKTSEMLMSMTVETPRWTRTLQFRSWDDREGERSFTRILAPKKDRGTGFLKLESSLWTYLPRVERVTRMPPSLLLQSWMGSDFTNDDIVRESSLIDDYVPSFRGVQEIDGVPCYQLELFAREEAPVVWARVDVWANRETLVPRRFLYYEEVEPGRFEPIRTMDFSDLREVDGRPFPFHWEMVPLDKEGRRTILQVEEVHFDLPLGDDLFTQTNLKRAEAVR